MKTVGKQLQEARLAKNWTPELAARETKIRVERVRDLEADDYSHFSSPTYARGFVRTYARSLGLDEYKLLRQLDNKLPEDDNASFANDSGIPYVPEQSRVTHASSGSNAGLYIVTSLGFGVAFIIAFVMFQAYRAGELQHYFEHETPAAEVATSASTNKASALPGGDTASRALPVDPNAAPPPAVEAVQEAPKATPVDLNNPEASAPVVVANAATNSAPEAPVQSVKALPVDPSELTNEAPVNVVNASTPPAPTVTPVVAAPKAEPVTVAKEAPRALPVDPSELAQAADPAPTTPTPAPVVAAPSEAPPLGSTPVATVPPVPTAPPVMATATSAADLATTNVGKSPVVTPIPVKATPPVAATASTAPTADKRLILTASRDSFVRVTALDAPVADQPLYASVLHSGQSVGFHGRKFSINVGIPSAVDITLDGVNYGPHSDQDAPETFTVESHLP